MKYLLTLLLLFGATLHARAEEIEKKIKLRGSSTYLKVDLNTTKKVRFWGVSTGNMTSYLQVYGSLPPKAKLNAKAAFVQKTYEKALSEKKFHYEIDLLTQTQVQKKRSQCLPISVEEAEAGISVEDFPPLSDPACDSVGAETLQVMADTLSEAYGGDWGVGNACAYFIYSIGGSPDYLDICDFVSEEELAQYGLECIDDEESEIPEESLLTSRARVLRTLSPERVQLYGLLNKDACLTQSKPEYIVIFDIDLSKVDPAEYPGGLNISFSAKETKVSKGKQAAIKPESEGRYKPKPIVMMNWLGDTCGNQIDVVSWKKFVPVSFRPLTIYGLLSYKGMVLNLALVDKVLTGGQATFNLSTKRESYGVCFSLQRKRQNKNGYPK